MFRRYDAVINQTNSRTASWFYIKIIEVRTETSTPVANIENRTYICSRVAPNHKDRRFPIRSIVDKIDRLKHLHLCASSLDELLRPTRCIFGTNIDLNTLS